jgi:hypothetical protein
VATRVRDWATVDYYAVLGVDARATEDEITRAFRAEAKRSHPDATADPVAAERFKDLAAAYTVLSDRRLRRDYDRVRAATVARLEVQSAAVTGIAPRRTAFARWTRRRAWLALAGGVAVTVLGVASAYVTWRLHDRDADRRAQFVPVAAQRLGGGDIRFTTPDGRAVVTREPSLHGEGAGAGPTVDVRYDPEDPQQVIVETGTFGRDITLALVSLKLLVGGPVFVVLGRRALRRT